MPRPNLQSNYIPASDAGFNAWLQNFSISAQQTALLTFGLTTALQSAIESMYTNWNTTYMVAFDPATRTPASIKAKNDIKNQALKLARQMNDLVQGATKAAFLGAPTNLALIEQIQLLLSSLKVTVPVFINYLQGSGRHRAELPSAPPVIEIHSFNKNEVTLTYFNDQKTPNGENSGVSRKKKPRNVLSCEVELFCPDMSGGDQPNAWVVNMTKSPSTFDAARCKGHAVFARGRWVGRNNQKTQYGPTDSIIVPGEADYAITNQDQHTFEEVEEVA